MLNIEYFGIPRFVPRCPTSNIHRQCYQTSSPFRKWLPEENQVQEFTRYILRPFAKRRRPFSPVRIMALIPSRSELRIFPRALASQPLPTRSNGRQSRSQIVSKGFGINRKGNLKKRRIQRERSVVASVLGLFMNTKKISAGLTNNPSSLRRQEIRQIDSKISNNIEFG